MSAIPRASTLAPFRIRSFRFQWPADMATSWAFEMENLILGWYVLVETGSVLLLTVFASLLYIGTLLAPMFGVVADRIGHRNLLCAMRGIYATLATTLMILSYTDVLTPVHVLVITALMGLVRPSDIGMRAALVGETVPPIQLISAMGIQRTTQDSARIAGALSGAGLVALLGMGPAYTVVAALYGTAMLLTKAGAPPGARRAGTSTAHVPARPSPWRDLKEGLGYVWTTPHLLAVMCLAFLLNLTAFPLMHGLMPVVAKQVYQADQTTLGYMVAGAACGALIASIAVSRIGHVIRPGRLMLIACGGWYAALLLFAHMPQPESGIPVLLLVGCGQSVSQVPMAAILLRTSNEKFRGRLMGIRMLAIYGNLPGLLVAGPLIANFGYPVTATLYCALGLAFTWLVATHWRAHLWRADALANTR
ncbi:MAG: arabinose ABC transporter permease [Betaproteobacteria bacterium SG8_41]|nr:MAG: arabinose ABC transporter permease [Betaproteobacteria bacterium SG8_41]